jgi:hypothetical protein
MWTVLSALAMAGAFVGCLALVQTARSRTFGSAAPLALAMLVSLEAVLLHLLSPFEAVGRGALVAGNLAIAVGGVLLHLRYRPARRLLPPMRYLSRGQYTGALVPLGLLAALSAVEYLPNNFDSMTYHLARVAYWLQNHSVDPYPTNIARQVAHPPGAEYLLLALQVISRSDRLANLLQLGAWVAMVLAAGPLARSFGAPRRVAAWASVLVGTLPVGLLEASSTQNDLVAANMPSR